MYSYMKCDLRKARVSFMSQASVKKAAGVYNCIMWPFTMLLVSRKSQLERMWRKGVGLLQGAGNKNCLQKATGRTKNESVVCTCARIECEASNVRSRIVISDPRYHLICGNECAIQGWLTSQNIRKYGSAIIHAQILRGTVPSVIKPTLNEWKLQFNQNTFTLI
jgi:hypothetical protein